jgi:IclR family pca regulon transcriptional regulator
VEANVIPSTTAPQVKEGEFVEALARGLLVIEAFDENHSEMTLSEVARRVGVTASTARRSLWTLASLGYVRQVNKKFTLSARILTLGSAYLRATHIEDALVPELRRLVAMFGDAASVSILDGHDILYLGHVSQQRGLRPTASVGITYPAYATSMGRVLLAGLSPVEFEKYLVEAKLEKLTAQTEIDPRRLRAIVQEARIRGYATAVDQLAYGITSLAVPVIVRPGHVVAALNSSGYTGSSNPKIMVAKRLKELRLSASRVAGMLTRHPALLHSLMRDPFATRE